MLTPTPMLAKKNRIRGGLVASFALFACILIVGCTPPGPRALLKGKKYLDRGDYAAAVAELKTATSLLATNAQAWNYYGVALQHNGQPSDAVIAYQRALTLDRDLLEAHYNLGCLWLEQNKPDDAKSEFTAYTLRRSNTPEGWLKLGAAQLQAGDILSAEKSFSTALHFSTNNPEAFNGLGLARVKRGQIQDAAQFFAAAIRADAGYAPAILNLATVNQQYLHDNKTALANYRAYLALIPRPANWDAVNAIANGLEQSINNATDNSSTPEPTPPANPPKTQVATSRATTTTTRPRSNADSTTRPAQNQTVQVQPQPQIVATPDSAETSAEPKSSADKNSGAPNHLNPLNWFRSGSKNETQTATSSSVTPTPAPKPVKIFPPAPPVFPRYLYSSPAKPAPGDRASAERAFTRAREAEIDSRWPSAMDSYHQAATLDPSWFEAQYNYGVLAYRLQNYQSSLMAYEKALAIQPDSVNARFNFALALKAAGYVTDAVNELKKVLAANPDEVRAHLALGNIYAQQLNDPEHARQEYLKVLKLDPRNPQAPDIQFWLSANPP
ncbi:MAG TPA: tetratricopeptide repeat protein [Verrucomicrobiae bacterium]|nr:tetratricopeptide repeat protein [Verrucomicrobiae bacterium]